MTSTTTIRATLTDEQLIEQYENELYDKDLSERELINMALEIYFSERNEKPTATINIGN